MFVDFFYKLRDAGIPVTPTSFLTLHRALCLGLAVSLDGFYLTARTILVKSERHFDSYDQVFASHFEGIEIPDYENIDLSEVVRAMLHDWLHDPIPLAQALDLDPSIPPKLTPEELIEYFKKRLARQRERHDGGGKWIGTGGTSPVGHSGVHPGGMRVGGVSRNRSAVKVALDRRYKDYTCSGPLTRPLIGEALKRLRHMAPEGPKDLVHIDKTIYQTTKNAGEIEIVFDRRMKNRLKVVLCIDNGGWSMDPYISAVQILFDYARSQFKDLKIYFFHNTIYENIWEDPARCKKPRKIEKFARFDPQTRLIVVGDASMAPYELMVTDGSIHIEERSGRPSIECLAYLSETFPRRAWLNPTPKRIWDYTRTITVIREMFPMFELTLDGLESAVTHLTAKK